MSDSSYEVNVLDKESYETVKVIVEIRRRVSDGAVFTLHRPLSPGDALRMSKWPSSGLQQVAYSLMVEYLRQEAQNSMQRVLDSGKDMEDVTPEVFERGLAKRVGRSVRTMIRGVVQSTVESFKANHPA